MTNIRSTLNAISSRLANCSDSARLDAEILLGLILQTGRAHLLAHPDKELTTTQLEQLEQLVAQRMAGVPVAHLTGRREFWSLEFTVTPAVLVPRPETELLVEQALHHIPAKADYRLADLGCGSGAIAIALATERPLTDITATDISDSALAVAETNADKHCPERIRFHKGDWCAALGDETFNMLITNPPYIADESTGLTDPELAHEPRQALYSGTDGLDDIRRIIATAPGHLRDNGWLLLEHGFDQAAAVADLLGQAGFVNIECHRDLAKHDRVTSAQLRQT